MGIYQYTLRSATKDVSGVRIAQYRFAYKHGWDVESSPVVQRKLSAADRAAEKLRHEGVELAVHGDWYDGQPVYQLYALISDFTEELRTAPVVGHLCKDSRGRWHYVPMSEQELLAKYPEIGVLQTEEGLRYYVNGDDPQPHRYSRLPSAMTAALIKRLISRDYRY